MSEAERKTIRVVGAVIERGGRYLITQRRPNAVLPLLWEFPGGRVEHGEERSALHSSSPSSLFIEASSTGVNG